MDDVALVTGGARRIGRAIVEHLAAAGYKVAIHCSASRPEAEALAARLEREGRSAAVVQADLGDGEAVAGIMAEAKAALGPVTLLVNNASLFEPDEVASLDPRSWERHMAINVSAPVFLVRDMCRLLPENRPGAVVNVLDQRVLKLTPQFFSYTLSKSALFTATRTMAQALAPRIRVNAVAPGATLASKRQKPEDFARQSAAALLGRGPEPREVAEAVLYLARARSITGQLLMVDGGQHLAWQTPDSVGISE